MKIPEPALAQMRELRAERDRCAARLGAAVMDLRRLEDTLMRAVESSRATEKRIAEREIAALGLDPDGATYDIDYDTGDVTVRGSS